MGTGSRRTSDGDCAAAGSQSRLGLPGAGAGAEDRPTHRFSDRCYRRSRVAEMDPALRAWLEQEPGLSLAELCERLVEQGISIKIGALWHQLNKWNLTFEKTLHASAQEREDVQRARSAGRQAPPTMEVEKVVFIDETWISTHMTRRYGRAQREALPRLSTARAWGETTTFVGARRRVLP